jgi:RNA polymerase primary sigma factor
MSAVEHLPGLSDAQRLTPAQERDLVIATEAGDDRACRDLVNAFLPQIAVLAAAFHHGPGVTRRELVQEGVAGLLVAARRFDAALGSPFWGYASFWVRKAMQEFVAEMARPVSLSDRAVRQLAEVRSARSDILAQRRLDPSAEELSRLTGLARSHVERLQATERVAWSLEAPTSDGMSAETVGDRIADPGAERAFDGVLDEIELRETRALTGLLDDRERGVIHAHYGLGGEPPRTLRSIGESLGLTAERVRQIEARGLAKLRASRAGTIVVPDGRAGDGGR